MQTGKRELPHYERTKEIMKYYRIMLLYYLLPRETIRKYRLPIHLPRNPLEWLADDFWHTLYFSRQFRRKLIHVWAGTIWKLVNIRGARGAFSEDDPMRILMENTGIWVELLNEMGYHENYLALHSMTSPFPFWDTAEFEGFIDEMSQYFWEHPDLNTKMVYWIVSRNRAHEDFSGTFSNVKIDFHRKYNHTQTNEPIEMIPLDSLGDLEELRPTIDDVDTTVSMEQFFALLDDRDVKIAKLLYTGYTQAQIASYLGYANHSAVAKRLAYIRREYSEYRRRESLPQLPKKKQQESTVRYIIIPFSYRRVETVTG